MTRTRPRPSDADATPRPPHAAPQATEAFTLPKPVKLRAPGCRAEIRTATEAVQMIDNELAAETRRLPRWTFARALFIEAIRTRKGADMRTAVRQLQQALSNDGWLAVGQR
jgi:hypothetical protein